MTLAETIDALCGSYTLDTMLCWCLDRGWVVLITVANPPLGLPFAPYQITIQRMEDDGLSCLSTGSSDDLLWALGHTILDAVRIAEETAR